MGDLGRVMTLQVPSEDLSPQSWAGQRTFLVLDNFLSLSLSVFLENEKSIR